jgi:hypothetical protein
MDQPLPAGPPSRDRSAPGRLSMAAMLLVSLGLVALGGTILVRSWKPRTLKVHMLTDLALNQALVGKQIAAHSRRHGLEIELTNRPVGAFEALELVDTPNPIDLALVAGGITRRDYPNVRQVTALATMPAPGWPKGGWPASRGDGSTWRRRGPRRGPWPWTS